LEAFFVFKQPNKILYFCAMQNEKRYRVIVVGSGPGAVMAAQTLVEAGHDVAMLDVGNQSNMAIPPENLSFSEARTTDAQQHHYFLGKEFETVPSPEITTGAQLTPSRRHIIKDVNRFCPIQSDSFFPMESLAKGGLGVGWGLGAYIYNDDELESAGLPIDSMRTSYAQIADRIGISCGKDDIQPFVAQGIQNLLPPLTPDNSIQSAMKKYEKRKDWFKKNGIVAGMPSMALLSVDFDKRQATKYSDMDFYADHGFAAWRPQMVVDRLSEKPNFTYFPKNYVLDFQETNNGIKVRALHTERLMETVFYAEKLVLAAGALGTARIALRSLHIDSLPILCNPYSYMPAISPARLGKPLSEKKTSMAQAMLLSIPKNPLEIVSVALYTYRSLLLTRLVQQSPLNIRDNLRLFNYLQSAFVIAGVHFPDTGSGYRKLTLIPDSNSPTGDALKVDFQLDDSMIKQIKNGEYMVKRALKKMGIRVIKKLNPGLGSSIHYGGTLPVSTNETLGTSGINGRIHGTKNCYVADGSGFAFLPAKGITLSIMANAHRVALNLFENE